MSEPAAAENKGEPENAYSGLFGAFPYAYRASESRLFRSYVVLGGVVAALVALLFTLGLVGVIASTTGARGGVFTFSRAFFFFVGFLVVAPLVAPTLFVARRHRRTGSTPRYDRTLALSGYLFIASLYLALVLSVPPEQQETPPALLAPAVEFLYGLPAVSGLVPPTLAAAGIYLAHRRLR